MSTRLCTVDGCEGKHKAFGLCGKHWAREWNKKNPEKVKARDRKWKNSNRQKMRDAIAIRRANDPEKYRSMSRAWDAAHREQRRQARKKRRKQFPEKECARVARRYAGKKKATPAWANEFFIQEIYHLAQLRTKVMGFKWHVDHIVPLRSKLVCGLHCEANLQVIQAADNYKKRNFWWPDMP